MRIKKGNLINEVDERQFEKLYKPQGWVADTEYQAPERDTNLDIIGTNEVKLKEYIKMKGGKVYEFNDGLIKRNGKI